MQCKQEVETEQTARTGSTEAASGTPGNALGMLSESSRPSSLLKAPCQELCCRVWTRTPAQTDNNDLSWQTAAEPNPEISMVKMG